MPEQDLSIREMLEASEEIQNGMIVSAIGFAVLTGGAVMADISSQIENKFVSIPAIATSAYVMFSGFVFAAIGAKYSYEHWKIYNNSGMRDLRSSALLEPVITFNGESEELKLNRIPQKNN